MPDECSTALNLDFGVLPRQNMTRLLLPPFLLACHYPCEDPGEPGPHCRWNSASLPGHTLPRQESGAISKGHQQQAGAPGVGDASSVRASDCPTQHRAMPSRPSAAAAPSAHARQAAHGAGSVALQRRKRLHARAEVWRGGGSGLPVG